jgi:two-component system, cell cycle response regulator
MNPTLRVALYGFSDFEHRALGSFFRLAARPALALEQVRDLAAAHAIVADADHAGVIDHLVAIGRIADTVFIGEHAPPDAAARLPRPIDALHVLRELDALATRRAAPPVDAAALQVPGPLAPLPAPRRVSAGFVSLDSPALAAAPAGSAAAPRRAANLSALLIDDSAVALRFLQLRLQHLGMDTELADGSARALELLAQRAYGFVFIDVELGEHSALDGLALCQHIKRQHRHVQGHTPVLVLVSAHHSELDRARGAFAGCDHYLAKPADERALRQLLSQHRPQPAKRAARR